VESAARLTGASGAFMFRVEDDLLRCVATSGTFRQTETFPLASPEQPLSRDWVTGRAVVDCQAIHVHDLAAAAAEFPLGRALQANHQHRSVLAVPLLREGQAIGAINVSRMELRPYSNSQIEL